MGSLAFLRQASRNLTSLASAMSTVKPFKKPRYDGRVKKRQWEERRADKGDALNPKKIKADGTVDVSEDKTERIKKRKHVLMLGYSGSDYYGMQRNPLTKTIEEDLFKALLKANLINQEAFENVHTIQFQRAARTDKGVSAVRQIVSLKLQNNVDISIINKELPEVIKVFAVKRVTKGFNAKNNCDSRTYSYLLPTAAFSDKDEDVNQKEYRVSNEMIERVNELLNRHLVGTKNFHNFTSRKSSNDPSAKRFIKLFTCEKPFLRKGVEFAVLKVQGQSFMLHQIRKMVALLLAVVRNHAPESVFDQAFGMDKVNIPRAPGLGLVLDYVHYDRYNNKFDGDGFHEKLTWEEVENDVQEFKQKYIEPTIVDKEIENEEMMEWIRYKLYRHTYDDADNDKEDDECSDDEKFEAIEDDTKAVDDKIENSEETKIGAVKS